MGSSDGRRSRRTFLQTTSTLGALAIAGCAGLLGDQASSGDDANALKIDVSEGSLGPGETVTLQVTDGDDPVENAAVRIDYQEVGTTDADGRITVTLPQKSDVAIDVEKGDLEGEREIEFEGTPSDGDDGLTVEIVDGSASPGETVTVAVTSGGEPIAGAEIEVEGETAGTTDGDGRLEVTLPEDDEVTIEADTSDRSGELTISFEGE